MSCIPLGEQRIQHKLPSAGSLDLQVCTKLVERIMYEEDFFDAMKILLDLDILHSNNVTLHSYEFQAYQNN